MNLKITGFLLSVATLVFSFQACSTERKTAVAFTKKTHSTSLLVLTPAQLFKVNQKLFLLDSLDPVAKDKEAELLLENSLFLKNLNDSLFIANYMLGYKKELMKFGFNVFDESSMDQFFEVDSNTIQVSIAQLELEETLYPFRNETQIYGQDYYHDHELNAVFVNSWFDIAPLNRHSDKPTIYFATDMIVDEVDGFFDNDIFANEVRYMYNIVPINNDMIYEFAYDLGRVYAGYTFDFLLNRELDTMLPAEERTDRYWRFDPYTQTFFLAGEDRFITLDE